MNATQREQSVRKGALGRLKTSITLDAVGKDGFNQKAKTVVGVQRRQSHRRAISMAIGVHSVYNSNGLPTPTVRRALSLTLRCFHSECMWGRAFVHPTTRVVLTLCLSPRNTVAAQGELWSGADRVCDDLALAAVR